MHQSARFQTIFSNNRPAESRVLAIFASQPILKNLTTGQGRRSEHAQAMGILEGPRILKVEGKSAVQYSRIRTGRAGSAAFDAMSMPTHGRLRWTPDVPRAAARAFIGRFGDSLSGRGDGVVKLVCVKFCHTKDVLQSKTVLLEKTFVLSCLVSEKERTRKLVEQLRKWASRQHGRQQEVANALGVH